MLKQQIHMISMHIVGETPGQTLLTDRRHIRSLVKTKKGLSTKLYIENRLRVNSCATEGYVDPTPLVTSVVLLLLQTWATTRE